MNYFRISLLSCLLFISMVSCELSKSKETNNTTYPPANIDASKQACSLLSFLYEIEGKKCMTGQHAGRAELDMISGVHKKTGKYPAIIGLDVGIYNITKGTDDYKNELYKIVDAASDYYNNGGLVTISWHWIPPNVSKGSYSTTKNSDFDIAKALQSGSVENEQLLRDLDEVAEKVLKPLAEMGVPVLWRPLHEMSGEWFWWSKGGKENFKQLWNLMFDCYTNYHKLDNLLWVFSFCKDSSKWSGWYPGHSTVDILGTDVYVSRNHLNYASDAQRFKKLKEIGEGRPCAYTETDIAPEIKSDHKWIWFLVWHGEYANKMSIEKLKMVYSSETYLTQEELAGH